MKFIPSRFWKAFFLISMVISVIMSIAIGVSVTWAIIRLVNHFTSM